MRFVEHYLQNPANHLFLGEDGAGLFILFRYDTDAVEEIRYLRNSPTIKWFRDFSNQRPDDPDRGAREAASDLFSELRQRNLDLPAHLDYLNQEVREDASPSH